MLGRRSAMEEALEVLSNGLGPFVESILEAPYSGYTNAREFVDKMQRDGNHKPFPDGSPTKWNHDRLLDIFIYYWLSLRIDLKFNNDGIDSDQIRLITTARRGWANELMFLRNKWAHQNGHLNFTDTVDFINTSEKLLDAIGKYKSALDISYILEKIEASENSVFEAFVPENPKPYRAGAIRVEQGYRISGNYTVPLRLRPKYDPTPSLLPIRLRDVYVKECESLKLQAREKAPKLWDGAAVRLNRITYEESDEAPAVTLHLGPTSWFQYMILNENIDEPVFENGDSIRDRYADEKRLYNNTGDLTWCPLSNILTILLTPITADGYGLVQYRDKNTNASMGDKWGAGVSENMCPFMDEANPNDLWKPVNHLPKNRPADWRRFNVPSNYVPAEGNTISPYLTAMRGVFEELSEELENCLGPEHYDFLNICWDLSTFQPALIGIVNTHLYRHELDAAIEGSSGKDHAEAKSFRYLRLNPGDPETAHCMRHLRWDVMASCAFLSAIQYYQAIKG